MKRRHGTGCFSSYARRKILWCDIVTRSFSTALYESNRSSLRAIPIALGNFHCLQPALRTGQWLLARSSNQDKSAGCGVIGSFALDIGCRAAVHKSNISSEPRAMDESAAFQTQRCTNCTKRWYIPVNMSELNHVSAIGFAMLNLNDYIGGRDRKFY